MIDGIVIEKASVEMNARVGGLLVILALSTSVFSMAKKSVSQVAHTISKVAKTVA
jgi:MFS transporter, DHA1 family, purine base/nucleoside efflux pump